MLLFLLDLYVHAGMVDGYVYSGEFSNSWYPQVTFDGPLLWL